MSGIFISYRRSDTAGYVGRLYPALARAFGRDRVFMDIDTLTPGRDFAHALDEAVTACDVLIAVIGPAWLNATDEDGNRRLDDPDDWVRQELAKGLERDDILVIPVLVGEARMPRPADLPDDLKALTRRQAFPVGDGRRWNFDVGNLIAELRRQVRPARSPVVSWILRPLTLAATAALLGLVVVLGLALYNLLSRDPFNWRGDQEEGLTPTEQLVATEEPTQEPQQSQTLLDLDIIVMDEESNLIGGACWQLLLDGNVVTEACDDSMSDPLPSSGEVGLYGIPAGDYILHLSQAPDGYAGPGDQPVTIDSDVSATIVLSSVSDVEVEPPAGAATEEVEASTAPPRAAPPKSGPAG